MNDRIKDLAEHCDFYVGNEHSNESYEEKQRLWVEKFAELIVRECCGVLYDNELGGYQVDYVLKEHFGVEE